MFTAILKFLARISSWVDPIRCGVEIYICPAAGSVNVHSRLTVVANASTERFLSHPYSNLCKSYHIQLSPFPPLVFDLLWTESSSTIGGLPLVRAFFYNRPGVSSILHQVQCVFAKGLQASFFQISQIRPTSRFSGPGCYQLPKIVAGTCWWLSWLCARCARPEISGCARAEHQPPGPLKQRQQATAYLERIHMKLPTSNCLQSTFQYVNFVNDLMRTPLIQRRQSNPPPPRIFFKEVYSPAIPVSDLNARVSLLSTTVHCSGFWPLIILWDRDWWLLLPNQMCEESN